MKILKRTIAVIAIIFAVIMLLFCLAVKPETSKERKAEMMSYSKTLYAHRGLFDNENKVPENSMAAFTKAVESGYGIELDVQLTKDNQAVIFHDYDLERMTGQKGKLTDLTYDELSQLRLLDTDEQIPLFTDVLSMVNGQVPIVVEIKVEKAWKETTAKTAEILDSYKGEYCIECFNPNVVAWYKDNRPEVIRGQLANNLKYEKTNLKGYEKFVLTNLLLNFKAKPDFIAYNYKYKNTFGYKLCRALYKPVNVAWTIRSEEALKESQDVFQFFIFDSFVPELNN